jgi:hypothetical protein
MACIEWDPASIDAADKLRRAFRWKKQGWDPWRSMFSGLGCRHTSKTSGWSGVRNPRIHNRALMANLTAKLLSTGRVHVFLMARRKSILALVPKAQQAT